MKVLMISNSFGVNLQQYAFDIAKANGFDLDIYVLFIGGCELSRHVENIKKDSESYELFHNGEFTKRIISIRKALEMERWDYVSLQQASHASGIIDTYYPYFEEVYTYMKTCCPNAKIMFHKTWAYSPKNPQMYIKAPTFAPFFTFKNEEEMKAGIDRCVKKILKEFHIDLLIDSGDVVYDGMRVFDDCYDEAGFHMNDLGCYLIGLNLVAKLFGKRLDKAFVPKTLPVGEVKRAINFINRRFETGFNNFSHK